jgi:hypothetical protein
LLCLIAFVATGATVIWIRGHHSGGADWYTATATIWHRSNHFNKVDLDPSKEPLGPDPASVERQIVSKQNLRHALSRLEHSLPDGAKPDPWAVADETMEQVRRQLRVACTGGSGPDRKGISVTYLDGNPDRAVQLVNGLARGYVEQYRTKLEATVHQDYLKARDAAEFARREYLEAKGRFDDFVAQHFRKQQALAERKIDRPPEPPDSAQAPPIDESENGAAELPAPQPGEIPEHVELGRQLAGLREHRAQLLLSRTPVHPEVQYVNTQIADLRERLASIPVGMDERPPVPPPSQDPPWEPPRVENLSDTSGAAEPEERGEEHAEAVRAYDAHREAVAQARQEYDRLSEIKRRAWERELRAVSVELDLAEGPRLYRPTDRSPRSLLGALAAALAVAFGVGMISAGFDTDLPLAMPTEVERALGIPVVGRIPARESSPGRTTGRGSRRARRLAKILGGTLLVGVCYGILVLVF